MSSIHKIELAYCIFSYLFGLGALIESKALEDEEINTSVILVALVFMPIIFPFMFGYMVSYISSVVDDIMKKLKKQ